MPEQKDRLSRREPMALAVGVACLRRTASFLLPGQCRLMSTPSAIGKVHSIWAGVSPKEKFRAVKNKEAITGGSAAFRIFSSAVFLLKKERSWKISPVAIRAEIRISTD
jgi:hypothetical protein